ncbi:hypothetical protein FZI85_29995 [Mycobacterium sp. CBMA293]|uniref:hypothetical protein n=1 Tax=unclassified Mycolicibacterium TaxID=2636767 RepID=UPI0012DF54B4|nr:MULTISPECIES: hypothetical protein [unclassified Mycolicibacterium]QGT51749.1 hypothetical protein pCBMA213_3_00007 [Mycolicibacterium sp.]MUL50069.1 hypothetical protein [Mycolicibacterium sp. CBMA 360]MUL62731.1 hypothetical protein [Mycolicibacterium sp. CBMA 335]MUL69624.1 hypothetical protein [Mycolicibacterium sp. CBMA 311]MUL97410.1 hypothetical protein [Mycolicibacterium sp. CBMA 230]
MSADKRPNLTKRPSSADADKWVHGDTAPAPTPAPAVTVVAPTREPTRRLTLDIPETLHRKMKIKSATTGVPIVAEVTQVLDQHYAEG